jgi:hypothetical protein
MTVIKDDDGIYIETEDMQITVEETDIGCTNGVIHLIRNVIMKNDYTVWQAGSSPDQDKPKTKISICYFSAFNINEKE